MQKSAQILLPVFLLLFSCKRQENDHAVTRAFYHWKTIVAPTDYEKQQLEKLAVNKIYLKFFDVVWNKETAEAEPVAKLMVNDSAWLANKEVIPTIFITNECFYELDSIKVEALAKNITSLTDKLAVQNGVKQFKELQIDCDWSKTTRDNYFLFLKTIRKLNPGKISSATIRLHQVKYRQRSGVPPADRGLLMAYNMGDLQSAATKNSIIDVTTVDQFINNLPQYPLLLDIGLPLFSWLVIFDNDKFVGLIRNVPAGINQLTALQKEGNGYTVKKDTILDGRQLRQGQFLRLETSASEVVEAVGKKIAKKINTQQYTVSLYHLDSITLKKYSGHELENIFNSLR